MRLKVPKQGHEELTEAKARIIAHLIGDGAHFRTGSDYVMKYEVKDTELLKQFTDDMIEVYGLAPTYGTNISGKTGKPIPYVRLRSRTVFEDLLRYATYYSKDWSLKEALLKANKDTKKAFLRALFDDEGSVKSKRHIALYSINKEGLLQVKDWLDYFDVHSKLKYGFGERRNVFALMISDFHRFNDKIGFSLSRKQERLVSVIKD